MEILKLEIDGAFLSKDTAFKDVRGVFTETWERNSFSKTGIEFRPDNSCFAYNEKTGTLRGLHYQAEPNSQAKIVSCMSGKIYDVMIDLRPRSSTFLKWQAIELLAFDGQSVYIPKGCAHGYLTLQPNTVVSYLIEGDYNPQAAKAVRWNDSAFSITWPIADPVISGKDLNAPDFII
jgi:dTDP-4-dehydrorhamnose 3,5-epimerase